MPQGATVGGRSHALRHDGAGLCIPVPHGGGRHADLKGILPGQSSTASVVEQIVDFPLEVFKVFAQDKVQLHHPHLLTPAGVLEDADKPFE